MPNQRGVPQHTAAIPQRRWDEVGKLAEQQGTDRTKLINAFLAWYCREPRAKLPKRPPE